MDGPSSIHELKLWRHAGTLAARWPGLAWHAEPMATMWRSGPQDRDWSKGLGVVGDLSRPPLANPGPEEFMLEMTIMVVILALLVVVLAGYVPPALDAIGRFRDLDVDQGNDRNE
jgi:hypothetical protein